MAAQVRKPGDLLTPAWWDDSRQFMDWQPWDSGWVGTSPSNSAAGVGAADPSVGFGPDAAFVPTTSTDPIFGQQWHLQYINAVSVWNDYTGKGVKVGLIDDGFDYKHKDIAPNYNLLADYDARNKDSDAYCSTSGDKHGTTTSGTIAAAAGNGGAVGVAFGAEIDGFRMGFGTSGSTAQILDDMSRQGSVDISNNSWGYGGFFYDNFASSTFSAIGNAIADAAMHGRGGLGTTFVFAAGNDRTSGQDVNYHNFQNSKYDIAVGALNADGTVAYFSDPGAALLLSAPGVNITTTDRVGTAGYAKGDFATVSGTSYSAPIVSGVIALMLEANPHLGARDVQEILAYSARNPTASNAGWQINHADDWNGGGLHVSNDYGFGLVDAHAAVRLAETWDLTHTWNNVLVESGGASPNAAIPDGSGSVSSSITITDTPMTIDRVDVNVDISHTWIGDLIVTLTSPTGTMSTLVNRPGVSSSSLHGSSQDNIAFTLDTVQDWGENSNGTWTLTVQDVSTGYTGKLNSWSISLYGDAASADNVYVYTDEFGRYSGLDTTRHTLSDAGGTDTINMAAVTTNVILDMHDGATSTVAGTTLTIAAGTIIENAVLGDGNDVVYGNDANNVIAGGRGSDVIYGGAGADTFVFMRVSDAGDVIQDYAAGQDHIDVSSLLASIGYHGTDPFADMYLQESVSGGNLLVSVDSDGTGATSSILLVTLTGVTTTLHSGTDVLIA